MNNASSLDTCILIRLIAKDDEKNYKKALALVSDDSQTFLIDDAALIETVSVLNTVYRHPRAQIVEELNALLSLKNLKSSNLFPSALDLYLYHPKLSMSDIYLAKKAEESSALPLWTLDKKLSTQLPSSKYL